MGKQLMVKEPVPVTEIDTYKMVQDISSITDTQTTSLAYIVMSIRITAIQSNLDNIRSAMVTKDELKDIEHGVEIKLNKLEAEIAKIQSELGVNMVELRAKVSELEVNMVELRAKVSELEINMVELGAKISELEIRVSKLEDKMSQLEIKVSELGDKIVGLETKIDKIQSELDAKIAYAMNELLRDSKKRDDRLYKTLIITATLIVMILGILIKF